MAAEFAAADNKSTCHHVTMDQESHTADDTGSIDSEESELEHAHISLAAETDDGNNSSVTKVNPETGATEREAEINA